MGGSVKMFHVVDPRTQVRLTQAMFSKQLAESKAAKHIAKGRAAIVEEVKA
jgi:hypothetical protein